MSFQSSSTASVTCFSCDHFCGDKPIEDCGNVVTRCLKFCFPSCFPPEDGQDNPIPKQQNPQRLGECLHIDRFI